MTVDYIIIVTKQNNAQPRHPNVVSSDSSDMQACLVIIHVLYCTQQVQSCIVDINKAMQLQYHNNNTLRLQVKQQPSRSSERALTLSGSSVPGSVPS